MSSTEPPAAAPSSPSTGSAPPVARRIPLLLGAALGLGLVAGLGLGGCAEDELVCDDTGCYQCDGLGCRPADPDAPDCLTDQDCPDGALCTVGGCVDVCTSDDDCPNGLVCRDAGDGRRLCVEPDEPAPVCVQNEDCLASGVECRDGLCVPSDVCDGDEECADGEVCLDGRCRPSEDLCRFSRECEAGRQCVDGRCVPACAGDDDCVEGLVCDSATGLCSPAPEPPANACLRDEDCGEGEVCTDTRCVDGCKRDADCGEGRICTDTLVCIPDTSREVFCENDRDCREGSACVDGVCRIPCEDAAFCQRVATEIRFCVEGFCASRNEAMTDCARASDCSAGETCIDGICS